MPDGRPERILMNGGHPLAQGLVFAELGELPNSTLFFDSMATLNRSPNHGTLTNMAVPATAASGWAWDNYLRRWVCRFDGTDDGIALPSATSIPTGAPFTFSFWIKNPTTSLGRVFDNGLFYLYLNSSKLSADMGGMISTTNVATANWEHYTVTVATGAIAQWYRNGLVDATGDLGNLGAGTTTAWFGNRSVGGRSLACTLGDTLFHNRVLSPSEIQQLADPSNVMLSGLILPPRRRLFAAGVAGLTHYTLTTATGAFALTGNAIGIQAARKLTTGTGAFTFTGNAIGVKADRKLTTATGSYTLTGNAIGIRAARKLSTVAGAFSFTGNAIGLQVARKLTTGTGAFSLTGNAIGIRATRKLTTVAGAFALTGNAIGLRTARKLTTGTGVFTFTGNPIDLVYSGAPTGRGTIYYILAG